MNVLSFPQAPRPRDTSHLVRAFCHAAVLFASVSVLAAGESESLTIVDRGEDFANYQNVLTVTNQAGEASYQTNRYTALENGLHYLENGEWKLSEDLVESFQDGAIAQRGPHRTIFSPDLHADAAFDILTSDGVRLRGGVRRFN
jgi:hypothetical protein